MRRDSTLYSASTLVFALSIIACGGGGNLSQNSANVNNNQTIQWAKVYGGGSSDGAYSIQQTSDGGYVVAGWTSSFGAGLADIWVLKLDANGDVQWQKTYGGSDSDGAYSIQQTSDGGYVVAGWTWSFGAGSADFWVLKLDANGDVQWQKTYGGGDSDEAYSIQQTSDGGYVVAGWTESFGAGLADIWVLKLDANGNIANCPLIGTSSAVVQDTSVTGNRTSITPSDTNVTPTNSNSTVNDTWVVGGYLCVP